MLQFGINPFPIHIPESKKVLLHNVHKGLNDTGKTQTANCDGLTLRASETNSEIACLTCSLLAIKIRIIRRKSWLQLLYDSFSFEKHLKWEYESDADFFICPGF